MVKSTTVTDPDLLLKCDEKYELIFNSQTQITAAHKRQSGTRCIHWHHLCMPLLATGLNIETLYLVYVCPSFLHIKYLMVLICSFWLISFINQRALYNHALSIIIIGIVLCQHQRWHWHLCPPPPGTWLDIETSYLVHICTHVPHICTSNI